MEEDSGLMDVLPDAVIQHLLCFMDRARDIAACSCVCKRWKELMGSMRRLVFPRNLGEKCPHGDLVITRMVLSMAALEELVVYCPISTPSLSICILHTRNSLKALELRVDNNGEGSGKATFNKLECLSDASAFAQLQTLRLWGGVLQHSPAGWQNFGCVQTLEIVGARMRDGAIRGILAAFPALRVLSLLGCDGVKSISIELKDLESCRLDFCGTSMDCAVSVHAPKLKLLEVQGASSLRIADDSALQHLMIAKQSGTVSKVEVGKLPALQSLSLRGLQWSWEAVQRLLQSATEVRMLLMKIEFCGGDNYEPFPEVDLAEFLLRYPKLKTFDVHGAMFAALSVKQPVLVSVLSPSLEEASITVRSPLNADKKLQVLEMLIKVSPNLKKLALRVTQMKNSEAEADEFFYNLHKMKLSHDFIMID